uniref:Uncharacterized protein n=1 Tax=Solanum tuberosum TaxID=4113 RepID=M1C6W0_SOLTU
MRYNLSKTWTPFFQWKRLLSSKKDYSNPNQSGTMQSLYLHSVCLSIPLKVIHFEHLQQHNISFRIRNCER